MNQNSRPIDVVEEESVKVLVSQSQCGTNSAREQLVRKYQGYLFSIAKHILGNSQDAEECVQETFMSVLGSIGDYQETGRFRGWLKRILLNKCRDCRKKQNTKSKHIPIVPESGGDNSVRAVDQVSDARAWDPAVQVETIESIAVVRKAMQQLPDLQKAILILKDYKGFSYESIAELLQDEIPKVNRQNAVSYLQQQRGAAIKKLRALLLDSVMFAEDDNLY